MIYRSDTTHFLDLVAEDLINRFGTDLANIAVVFPGRRARLFFNNYLYKHADNPLWTPKYFSMEELFEQSSDLQQADNIKLICELYKTYIEVYNSEASTPSTETLDEFYFFGEILLNDFNDIDKNLVNAHSLFSNLKDLDVLKDQFSHLNEIQLETLIRYFKYTFQGETSLQNAFWSVWNVLGKVYTSLKEKLGKERVAFPGMLMRSVIEDENISFPFKQYVFVGFNVLSKCEEELFKRLKDKALFYWDFDTYYLNKDNNRTNEAGIFIRENIQKFGSALTSGSFGNFLSKEKKITIISSASESGQSAYIPTWIDFIARQTDFSDPDSAIVLCNEQILPTVMHTVPSDKVENVNITMGFPLTQTPVCSFIQILTDLQIKGYNESGKAFRYKYVLPVLRHPYTHIIFPEAKDVEQELLQKNIFFPSKEILIDKEIFSYTANSLELAQYLLNIITRIGKSYENVNEYADVYGGLYQESIFRSYQIVNRIYNLIFSGELDIQKTTFLRLIRKLFSTTSIPFHGEPVKGLQIMGVLETRTLDFKNLLLLSVNEGFMPGTDNDNTFIPQFLRKHFGLSTLEHQDSIYAYYFYRLIQRAENITFVYNTDKTQTGKAEMSRFLLQMLTESGLLIQRLSLQSSIKPIQSEAIELRKSPEMIERIRNLYDKNVNPEANTLSPSALNTFIDCSLRFYLQYIKGLKVKDELSDELDSSIFGTIFHRSAELLYHQIGRTTRQNFQPFLVKKESFEPYIKHQHLLDKLVSQAFNEEYFKGKEVDPKQYNGEQLINFRVIRHMLKRLIQFDRQHTPFYIRGLEHGVYSNFEIPSHNVSLRIGGIIDCLQEKDDTLSIIDYKTSGTAKTYKTLEEIFAQKENRASHIFQTFIYASVLIKEGQKQAVSPALIYLQDAGKENYSPVIMYEKEEIKDFKELFSDFEEIFIRKIAELFDPEVPFQQTTIIGKCSYCDFKSLCNR